MPKSEETEEEEEAPVVAVLKLRKCQRKRKPSMKEILRG
jgi:hypothetical protein